MSNFCITKKQESEYKLAIGIMTGTSIDGIDTLLIKIKNSGTKTQYEEIKFENFDIPDKLRRKIRSVIAKKEAALEDICLLNYEISAAYRDAIFKILELSNLSIDELDFAAISGQTFFHIPKTATLQLGDGTYLANLIKKPVIWNFRASDIAAGGQGAPLVPYLDYVLFSKLKKETITLNIGGISNVTYIPSDGDFSKIKAFDCGPGNMIIDKLAMEHTGGLKTFDENAEIALNGKLSDEIFEFLKSHSYILKMPPKSTGREEFGDDFTERLIALSKKVGISTPDLIRTATEFTVFCIINSIKRFILPDFSNKSDGTLICAGGGAKNPLIFKLISDELIKYDIKTIHSEDAGVSAKSKEALLMIVLGNETIYQNTSNVPSATGAKRAVITGTISIA